MSDKSRQSLSDGRDLAVRQIIDGSEPLGDYASEIDGPNGKFIIREQGGHPEAGRIRQYIDGNYNFFFYFKYFLNKDKQADLSIISATTKRLGGGQPNIDRKHIDVIINNIVFSFRTREIGSIKCFSNENLLANISFEWNN